MGYFVLLGGANSNSTFEYLDYEVIKQNPKIICGFSDSTSILNIISEKTGLVTFNGPTFKSLTSWETEYSYKQIINRFELGETNLAESDDKFYCIKEGIAEGKLIGGNLFLTSNLCSGTYNIDFTDKILFIEELAYEADAEMVSNYLYKMRQNFPIIKSNNFGHTDRKMVIPIGTKAKIDTKKEIKIELLENCVK